MSTIEIPETATSRPEMHQLAATLAELLATTADKGLPQPHYVTLSDITGSIGLQFPPEMGSINALIAWANLFGGVSRSNPHEGEHGPALWVSTEFTFCCVSIDAYAHIPAPAEGPDPL
ncbi:MAG TPA: hypothetical protein VHZ03_15705 [Trebonia sp.]|nr:hypothetical protein [Trebonia sp.]